MAAESGLEGMSGSAYKGERDTHGFIASWLFWGMDEDLRYYSVF